MPSWSWFVTLYLVLTLAVYTALLLYRGGKRG